MAYSRWTPGCCCHSHGRHCLIYGQYITIPTIVSETEPSYNEDGITPGVIIAKTVIPKTISWPEYWNPPYKLVKEPAVMGHGIMARYSWCGIYIESGPMNMPFDSDIVVVCPPNAVDSWKLVLGIINGLERTIHYEPPYSFFDVTRKIIPYEVDTKKNVLELPDEITTYHRAYYNYSDQRPGLNKITNAITLHYYEKYD
jgi:hypothetical protein